MANEAPLSFEANAYQSFVRGLRDVWRTEAYQGAVAAARKAGSRDPAEIERRVRDVPAYQLYAWLERHSQQMKYYGRWGIVRWMEARKDELAKILAEAARRHPERLALDPKLEIPDYVLAVDTHQHGGGLWSDPCDAFAFETSAGGYSFSLFNSKAPMVVYGDAAKELVPGAKVVVDMGCTIGGSTRALKRAFPEAKVTGIELCAPPLMLAHLRSLEQGLEVYYRQANAEKLPFETASADLVASHWLYHEMPPAAVRNSIRDSRRVLKKGGGFIAYDMHLLSGDGIGKWLHAGYGARNNEPFALAYAEMDMKAELQKAGFRDVKMWIAHPDPCAEVKSGDLPPVRTHYITMITARAA